MAIAVGDVSTSQQDGGASNTFAHDVAGSDTFLLVLISAENNATPGNMPVTGVTYNGDALTKIREEDTTVTPGGSADIASVWYLINPDAGTNNVIVSYTGVVEGDAVTAITLTGVSQSAPIDAQNGFKGNSANPSNAVTTVAANCLVLDVITGSGSGTTLTPGGSQTQQSNITNSGNIRSATSSQAKATPGSTTMSWTMASQVWAQIVVSIAPVAGSSIKTVDNLAYASVKTVNGLAVASVKSINGLQ